MMEIGKRTAGNTLTATEQRAIGGKISAIEVEMRSLGQLFQSAGLVNNFKLDNTERSAAGLADLESRKNELFQQGMKIIATKKAELLAKADQTLEAQRQAINAVDEATTKVDAVLLALPEMQANLERIKLAEAKAGSQQTTATKLLEGMVSQHAIDEIKEHRRVADEGLAPHEHVLQALRGDHDSLAAMQSAIRSAEVENKVVKVGSPEYQQMTEALLMLEETQTQVDNIVAQASAFDDKEAVSAWESTQKVMQAVVDDSYDLARVNASNTEWVGELASHKSVRSFKPEFKADTSAAAVIAAVRDNLEMADTYFYAKVADNAGVAALLSRYNGQAQHARQLEEDTVGENLDGMMEVHDAWMGAQRSLTELQRVIEENGLAFPQGIDTEECARQLEETKQTLKASVLQVEEYWPSLEKKLAGRNDQAFEEAVGFEAKATVLSDRITILQEMDAKVSAKQKAQSILSDVEGSQASGNQLVDIAEQLEKAEKQLLENNLASIKEQQTQQQLLIDEVNGDIVGEEEDLDEKIELLKTRMEHLEAMIVLAQSKVPVLQDLNDNQAAIAVSTEVDTLNDAISAAETKILEIRLEKIAVAQGIQQELINAVNNEAVRNEGDLDQRVEMLNNRKAYLGTMLGIVAGKKPILQRLGQDTEAVAAEVSVLSKKIEDVNIRISVAELDVKLAGLRGELEGVNDDAVDGEDSFNNKFDMLDQRGKLLAQVMGLLQEKENTLNRYVQPDALAKEELLAERVRIFDAQQAISEKVKAVKLEQVEALAVEQGVLKQQLNQIMDKAGRQADSIQGLEDRIGLLQQADKAIDGIITVIADRATILQSIGESEAVQALKAEAFAIQKDDIATQIVDARLACIAKLEHAQQHIISENDDGFVDGVGDFNQKREFLDAREGALEKLQSLSKQKRKILTDAGRDVKVLNDDDEYLVKQLAEVETKRAEVDLLEAVAKIDVQTDGSVKRLAQHFNTYLREDDAPFTREELRDQRNLLQDLLKLNAEKVALFSNAGRVDDVATAQEQGEIWEGQLVKVKQTLIEALAEQAKEIGKTPELEMGQNAVDYVKALRENNVRMQDLAKIEAEMLELMAPVESSQALSSVRMVGIDVASNSTLIQTQIPAAVDRLRPQDEVRSDMSEVSVKSVRSAISLPSMPSFRAVETPVNMVEALQDYSAAAMQLQAAGLMVDIIAQCPGRAGELDAHKEKLSKANMAVSAAKKQVDNGLRQLHQEVNEKSSPQQYAEMQATSMFAPNQGLNDDNVAKFFGLSVGQGYAKSAVKRLGEIEVTLGKQRNAIYAYEHAKKIVGKDTFLEQKSVENSDDHHPVLRQAHLETLAQEQETVRAQLQGILINAQQKRVAVRVRFDQSLQQKTEGIEKVSQTITDGMDSFETNVNLFAEYTDGAVTQAAQAKARLAALASVGLGTVRESRLQWPDDDALQTMIEALDGKGEIDIQAIQDALASVGENVDHAWHDMAQDKADVAHAEAVVINDLVVKARMQMDVAQAAILQFAGDVDGQEMMGLYREASSAWKSFELQLQDLQKRDASFENKAKMVNKGLNDLLAKVKDLHEHLNQGMRETTALNLAEHQDFLRQQVTALMENDNMLPAVKVAALRKLADKQREVGDMAFADKTEQSILEQAQLIKAQDEFKVNIDLLRTKISETGFLDKNDSTKAMAEALLAHAEVLYDEGHAPRTLTREITIGVTAVTSLLDNDPGAFDRCMAFVNKTQGHTNPRMQAFGIGAGALGTTLLVVGAIGTVGAFLTGAGAIAAVGGLAAWLYHRQKGMSRALEVLAKANDLHNTYAEPNKWQRGLDMATDSVTFVVDGTPKLAKEAKKTSLHYGRKGMKKGGQLKDNIKEGFSYRMTQMSEAYQEKRQAAQPHLNRMSEWKDDRVEAAKELWASFSESMGESWDNTAPRRAAIGEGFSNAYAQTQPARNWMSEKWNSFGGWTRPVRDGISNMPESVGGFCSRMKRNMEVKMDAWGANNGEDCKRLLVGEEVQWQEIPLFVVGNGVNDNLRSQGSSYGSFTGESSVQDGQRLQKVPLVFFNDNNGMDENELELFLNDVDKWQNFDAKLGHQSEAGALCSREIGQADKSIQWADMQGKRVPMAREAEDIVHPKALDEGMQQEAKVGMSRMTMV